MKPTNVQCRCGAVGLEIAGEPVVQFYCHCTDCQAAHDAAYVLCAIHHAAQVEVVRGTPTSKIIRKTVRMYCAACGTNLFSEIESVGMRDINAYLLPKGSFKPQFHVQCQDAVLPVVDGLPHYKAFPSAFGGSEEMVGW